MRARIFWGDSWVGAGLVCGVGVEEGVEREDEEGKVELERMSEERSGSSRRAIVVRDIVSLEERDSGTGSGCAGLDRGYAIPTIRPRFPWRVRDRVLDEIHRTFSTWHGSVGHVSLKR